MYGKTWHILRGLSFFTRRGAVCLWGDQNFCSIQRGGPVFFSVGQRGRAEFFEGHRGVARIFSQDGDFNLCKGMFFQGGTRFFAYAKGGGPEFFFAHTLSKIYHHSNWNSKLNTKLRLDFQVEDGFKLEFQVE